MTCCRHENRRDFLKVTLGASAGAMLASKFLLARGQDAAKPASAKSVILLWLQGGPSQLDTFDPKPGAETGGPFKAIDTSVKGIQLSEHLPKLAEQMHRFSLLRTVTSNDPNHETASFMLHTGYRRENTVEYPHMGCVIAHEIGEKNFDLPHVIRVGEDLGIGASYLGTDFQPLVLEKPDNPLEDIALPSGVSAERFKARMELLRKQNDDFAKERGSKDVVAHQKTYGRALNLIHSARLDTFDIGKESDATRKAYGDTGFGKACLLARRLVEQRVPFVEINLGDWDTHDNNFERVKGNLGTLDPAFASLIRDLDERGLLKSTLVLCMGEFGRTPQINGQNGRDHYTKAWSVAIAGGGIQPGRVVGRTDEKGIEPVERPVPFTDLFATVYACLGIEFTKKFDTDQGRPIKILDKGTPVKELLV